MLPKLAIRVCPVPGCPAIASKQGTRCPKHDRLMVREIYVRQADDPISKAMRDLLGDR